MIKCRTSALDFFLLQKCETLDTESIKFKNIFEKFAKSVYKNIDNAHNMYYNKNIERRKVMNFRQVDKIVREDGWYLIGASKSSHYQYKHPTKPRKGYNTKA